MSEQILAAYQKYQRLTMLGERTYVENLKLVMSSGLDFSALSIVECGTWRGGMTFGMLDLVEDCREFHAFDSFEGLPEPTDRDGAKAKQLSASNLFIAGRNIASYEEFVGNVERLGFSDRITVHKGWFNHTVSADLINNPIGILRLDGDWYDSTMIVLERLYDSVVAGGLVIIDDYYVWPGCSQAVHDFLSSRNSPDVIRSYGRLTAFIKKRPTDHLVRMADKAEVHRRKRWNIANPK